MPFDSLPADGLTQEQINCLALADYIERQPPAMFDIGDWGEPWCGTPGCIAGHAAALWPECRRLYDTHVDFHAAARKIGLPESNNLFVNWRGRTKKPCDLDCTLITPAIAADALRRFALTGEQWFDLPGLDEE